MKIGANLAAQSSFSAEKSALRTRLLAAREAARPLADASAAVCARLLRLPELAARETVLGYAATPREVDVDAVLEALLGRGVTVCLPWVDGRELGVSAVAALDELDVGWRGVREMPPERRQPLRPAALDLAIIPGVGFDRAGNRLGYGGGHFDRLLATLRRGVPVIGVALDEQLCAAVPVEPHDRPVDVIVTPTATLRP